MKKRHFLSYQKRRHDAQITWPYAYYVTLGSRCKMANSSSKDETDTLPERPTRIQPYQFEPVRQDFERVPEHHVSFDMRYSMGFAKLHSRHSKKVSSFELYKLNPLSPHFIVQELCESWGGRPGLSVLTSLLVSVDVKIYWTVLWHWSQLVPNMSNDIWGH